LGTKTVVIPTFMSMQMYGYDFLPNFFTTKPVTPCQPCNIPSVNKNCPYFYKKTTLALKCADNLDVDTLWNVVCKALNQ